jgi:hypothetical protein
MLRGGVSLSEITRSLERAPAKARFVVVDACRDVAFTKGIKETAKGLGKAAAEQQKITSLPQGPDWIPSKDLQSIPQ